MLGLAGKQRLASAARSSLGAWLSSYSRDSSHGSASCLSCTVSASHACAYGACVTYLGGRARLEPVVLR
jgi:hypothetical protein